MKGAFYKSISRIAIIYMILAICFGAICLINFSSVPSFYDGDMYCDYRYAQEAWEHRSIFPEGWVFGNQLNAVSTPVLAALLYGLSGNLNVSMAAACVIMAVLVVVSYDWMIKPALQETESRLVAIVLLITVTLYCGRAVHGNQGWTLLFTMCSYYAGYSMTAFLAFGCYIRSISGSLKGHWVIAIIACVLSFGTGIQSIRQTAVMVAPMLAVELLRCVVFFRSWKANRKPLLTAMGITISNVLGLLYVRMREINQNQIFGKIEITSLHELKQAILDCLFMIKDLLGADHPEALFIVVGLGAICVVSLVCLLKNVRKENTIGVLVLTLLIGISVAVIVAIDILSTMYIRPRYYFMLYPLIAFLFAFVYDKRRSSIKWCLFTMVIVFFGFACAGELLDVCTDAINRKEEESYEISAYLQENGYTTIYAEWNHGQNISVASNAQIQTGYWYAENGPFVKITHLCSLDVYDADPDRCVYLFTGEKEAALGVATAESIGVPLNLLCHYPQSDTYLYTAPENLMQVMEELHSSGMTVDTIAGS